MRTFLARNENSRFLSLCILWLKRKAASKEITEKQFSVVSRLRQALKHWELLLAYNSRFEDSHFFQLTLKFLFDQTASWVYPVVSGPSAEDLCHHLGVRVWYFRFWAILHAETVWDHKFLFSKWLRPQSYFGTLVCAIYSWQFCVWCRVEAKFTFATAPFLLFRIDRNFLYILLWIFPQVALFSSASILPLFCWFQGCRALLILSFLKIFCCFTHCLLNKRAICFLATKSVIQCTKFLMFCQWICS